MNFTFHKSPFKICSSSFQDYILFVPDLRRSFQEGRRTEAGLSQALARLALVWIFRRKKSSQGKETNDTVIFL